MDPAALIVSALVAGLTAGLTDTAKTAVKEAYDALKDQLQKRLADHPDAAQALAGVEKKPDSAPRQEVLKEELVNLKIEKDADLLTLAQSLLETLKADGAETGKYHVTISHSQGIAIGDQAQVVQKPTAKPTNN